MPADRWYHLRINVFQGFRVIHVDFGIPTAKPMARDCVYSTDTPVAMLADPLTTLMFPKVFPPAVNMAPGEVSGRHFGW